MEGVREYLLSVTAGAILCGILGSLVGEKGAFSELYKLISGLILCFLVLSPLVNIELSDFTQFADDLRAIRQSGKGRKAGMKCSGRS